MLFGVLVNVIEGDRGQGDGGNIRTEGLAKQLFAFLLEVLLEPGD